MRRYLRVDPPEPSSGSRTPFLRLMDLSASVLRHPFAAAFFAGPVGRPALGGAVRVIEWSGIRKPLGFAYSFLRDVEYFHALSRTLAASAPQGLARERL